MKNNLKKRLQKSYRNRILITSTATIDNNQRKKIMKYEIILNTENGSETLETNLDHSEAIEKAKTHFERASAAPSEESTLFVREMDTASLDEMMEVDTSAELKVIAYWSFEFGQMVREIIR